jgi:DNA-binding CsgD family transcriptional regulator
MKRDAAGAGLTPREIEVIKGIGRGETTRETAGAMGISVRTVESHALNAYRKLGVRSRVQLVRLLAQHGLLETDPG